MKNPKHKPQGGKPGPSYKPPVFAHSSQRPPTSGPSAHNPPTSGPSSQKPPFSGPPSQKGPSSGPNSFHKASASGKPGPNSFHKGSSSGKPGPNQSKKGKSRWDPHSNRNNNKPIFSPNPSKGKGPSSSASPAILPNNPNIITPPLRPPISAGPPHPHPHHLPQNISPTFSLPPQPPPYGFQNLDRRTIVLADGSVRSYFALPPDEPIHDPYGLPIPGGPGLGMDRRFPPPPHMNRFSPENPYTRRPGLRPPHLDGPSSHEPPIGKRKYSEQDELARQRMHVLQYGNPNLLPSVERENPRVSKHARIGRDGFDDRADNNRRLFEPDKGALRKSFLKFIRMIYENADLKKKYLENGRNGPLHCLACARASKEYKDTHELAIHSFTQISSEDRVDHSGLHKAICVLMGWNYENAPDNNKIYQVLSPEQAQANRDDLILFPPTVIIHNTSFGKKKDGRFEGFSNKDMDNILNDLGFPGGKARSIYSREGHMGVTCVQFVSSETGLKEAERLAHYFERQNHDRKGWTRIRPVKPSEEDDRNPLLVKKDERTGEKKRVLYGYMATVADLDVVDVDIKNRASIKSKRDFDLSE